MKKLLMILVIFGLLFVGCTNSKAEKAEEVKPEVSLEGMWTLQSGQWSNGDGTFTTFPDDSLMVGGSAYIVYSKSHYNVVAEAPKMNFFRAEHASYTLDESKIKSKIILGNLEGSVGKESEWSFTIKDNVVTYKNENDIEVWKKVE